MMEAIKKAGMILSRKTDSPHKQQAGLIEQDSVYAIHADERTAPAKILVIGDHSDSRSILRKGLQAAHYDVVTAENRAEGVNLAAAIRPDLILLDLLTSSMDGIEMCKRLRNTLMTQLIPVIFLTPHGESDEILSDLKGSAVDCVVKPYGFRELLVRIHTALEFRDEQRNRQEDIPAFTSHIVAAASNDLRNHLTVISGFAALLEQKLSRLERSVQRAYLDEIVQHTDCLADLVDGIECLFGAAPVVEEVDLVRTVTAAVERMCARFDKKRQRLHLKLPPQLTFTIRGSGRDLFTAVRHLLSHVHKCSNEGGTITVEVAPMDHHVRIQVTHPGMVTAREQHSLSSGYGESDLSLIMAGSIAEQHRGRIGIENQPGQGNSVWMALPLNHHAPDGV